jgi:GntR family transcriptional regulator, histidine utilization repressor
MPVGQYMSAAKRKGGVQAVGLNDRIRSDIERRISSGRWPPGHRVPFEHELVAQYGCSRMTVNKALSALADAGLIERRRRAGSFVARPLVHSAILTIPDLKAEVEGRGAVYGYRLLARANRRATARDRALLEGPAGARVLSLRCLHFADGLPFALEERILNLAVVPEARGVAFSTTPPGTWLLEHVPWTVAEHRIAATETDQAAARHLALRRGASGLALERRTWQAGKPVTRVRQLFPAHLHSLVARFSPSEPNGRSVRAALQEQVSDSRSLRRTL